MFYFSFHCIVGTLDLSIHTIFHLCVQREYEVNKYRPMTMVHPNFVRSSVKLGIKNLEKKPTQLCYLMCPNVIHCACFMFSFSYPVTSLFSHNLWLHKNSAAGCINGVMKTSFQVAENEVCYFGTITLSNRISLSTYFSYIYLVIMIIMMMVRWVALIGFWKPLHSLAGCRNLFQYYTILLVYYTII